MSTILIVDDQESISDMLCRIFGSRFDYRSARSVNAATALLETMEFDVVLANIAMPNQIGVEVVDLVRRLQPKCPLIIISEIQDVDRVQAMLRNGAFGHIIKPVQTHELQQSIELAVDSHRLPKRHDQLKAFDQTNGPPRAERFGVTTKVTLNSVLLFEQDRQGDRADDLLMIEGYTRDISETGLAIIVPAGSLDGQFIIGLTFHIVLDLSKGLLDIEARAVRSERLNRGYLIGAQITNMSARDRTLYLKYLSSLGRQR